MKSARRPGSVMFVGQRLQVVRQQRRQRDHLLEVRLDVPQQRVDLQAVGFVRALRARYHARPQVRPRRGDLIERQARQALDDQPQAAVGQLEHLVNMAGRADAIQVVLLRLFHRRVPLGEDANQLAGRNGFVDQPDGALARHRQRHERVGKEYRVAKRQDRKLVGHQEGPVGRRDFFQIERLVQIAHRRKRAAVNGRPDKFRGSTEPSLRMP